MANYKLVQDEKENMIGPNIAMLATKWTAQDLVSTNCFLGARGI